MTLTSVGDILKSVGSHLGAFIVGALLIGITGGDHLAPLNAKLDSIAAKLEAPEPPAPALVDPQEWIVDIDNVRIDAPDVELVAGKLPVGKYEVKGVPRKNQPWVTRTITVSAGVVPPKPPVVDPPKPPEPPQPPAPIPDGGLRVLMTYDPGAKAGLPRPQLALLDSTTLRAYLDTNCTKDAAGVAEWRIVPASTEFKDDQPIWKKAMTLPRASSEWLYVSNGKAGESVPLPANEAEALAIIARYAK
jgi:hypothetical protein